MKTTISNNDWFFSDSHLGHTYALKLRNREKFFKDIKEHDSEITQNILSVLSPGNNLYCLGDFSFKKDVAFFKYFFDELLKKKVNFHWIEGNHDKINFNHKAIAFKGSIKDIIIQDQPITLCHYPMYVWNKSHRGAWQLFGHIHKNDFTDNIFPYENLGKQLNVNIEFNNFMPYSFQQIKEIMNKKPKNFDILKKNF